MDLFTKEMPCTKLPNESERPTLQQFAKRWLENGICLQCNISPYFLIYRLWVATDEWTDSSGHAIINILLGCCGQIFVAATVQLDCKGPNLGVEHSELGTAVIDTLTSLGVSLKCVMAFVSDSASVLKKAYEEYLKPFCPNATWVPCSSHALNNVAKSILCGFGDTVTALFGEGTIHFSYKAVCFFSISLCMGSKKKCTGILPAEEGGSHFYAMKNKKFHFHQSTLAPDGRYGEMLANGGSTTSVCTNVF